MSSKKDDVNKDPNNSEENELPDFSRMSEYWTPLPKKQYEPKTVLSDLLNVINLKPIAQKIDKLYDYLKR